MYMYMYMYMSIRCICIVMLCVATTLGNTKSTRDEQPFQ